MHTHLKIHRKHRVMKQLTWRITNATYQARGRLTLPQGPPCSTISAKRLSFWVRNVTRRFPLAIAPETSKVRKGPHIKNRSVDAKCVSSNRPISTRKLNRSLVPAYTSSLSTQCSTGSLSPKRAWKSHLEAGFPLRCFQRLSVPNVANQPCPWQDNWYTRGSSNPVLSY